MPENFELAKIQAAEAEYPLLRPETMHEMLELFEENVGSAGISTLDLPRIQCPSGGALNWSIRTLDGDESPKEIEGIILAWKLGRLYWKKGIGEGGGKKPPDCTSIDGVIGVGDPGGICRDCPYAKFGSATKGHGQACKQIRQILLVRPGESMPNLLSVPPTSLKNASQYFLMLWGKQLPYWGVVTRIKLERTQNEDGTAYAKMVFLRDRVLAPQERATLAPYHLEMRKLLEPMVIDARDYAMEEAPANPTDEPTFDSGGDVPF